MKVLIDARKLFHGGIGQVTQNLILGLASTNLDFSLVINENDLESKSLSSEIRNIITKRKVYIDNSPQYSLRNIFKFYKKEFKAYDVIHFPHYPVPFFIKSKVVCTLHDDIHLKIPKSYPRYLVAKFLTNFALKKSDALITVSKYSYNQLKKLNRKSNIEILYNLPATFTQQRLISKPIIPDKYFLANISTDMLHKGKAKLKEAFKEFKKSDKLGYKLVIAGYGVDEEKDGGEDTICFSNASEELLLNLYSNMSAYVCSSSLEGFCIPVYTAHFLNKPAIYFPIDVILELKKDFDFVAKDMSANALANAMSDFTCSTPKDIKVDKTEFMNLTEYANQHLKIYQKVIES